MDGLSQDSSFQPIPACAAEVRREHALCCATRKPIGQRREEHVNTNSNELAKICIDLKSSTQECDVANLKGATLGACLCGTQEIKHNFAFEMKMDAKPKHSRERQ